MERRRFSRVIYQAPAQLRQGDVTLDGKIHDLSLHGLLLSVDADITQLNADATVDIQFSLPDSDVSIGLVAKVVSMNSNMLRASIDHIDIESIGHLKRLVELNVGDDALLNRELKHLTDLGDNAE